MNARLNYNAKRENVYEGTTTVDLWTVLKVNLGLVFVIPQVSK